MCELIDILEKQCTDYSVHMRDWPRHGFRYEVRTCYLFACGSGVGRTLEEAIKRSLKNMEKNFKKLPLATDEDLNELHL